MGRKGQTQEIENRREACGLDWGEAGEGQEEPRKVMGFWFSGRS